MGPIHMVSTPSALSRWYQLRAYVCNCGDVRVAIDMGVTTLTQVFQRRPDGCRFAVVQVLGVEKVRDSTYATTTYENQFLTIDLYELKTTDGRDVLLGEHKVFSTYEAAVAAAQMQL